jgi:hypothetical protein
MTSFFTFLQNNRSGILLFVFVLFAAVFLLQWLVWIFAKGRFNKASTSSTGTGTGDGSPKPARFVLTDFVVKIINEFRHLLALFVFIIFAFALGYSLIKAGSLTTGNAIDNLKGALEGVVATLGGLIGSIIGYYFGESSVTPTTDSSNTTSSDKPLEQKPPATGEKTTGAVKTGAPPIKDQRSSSPAEKLPDAPHGGTSTGS